MKLPRKVVLNESVPFFLFFMDFWEKFKDDFNHINLEHILFIKADYQSIVPGEENMKIEIASDLIQKVIPGIKFVLTTFPSFNNTLEDVRDENFYSCLFKIPKNYENDLYLKKPDIVAHSFVLNKFKEKKLGGLSYGKGQV